MADVTTACTSNRYLVKTTTGCGTAAIHVGLRHIAIYIRLTPRLTGRMESSKGNKLMAIFQIWLDKNPRFRPPFNSFNKNDFKHVADVDCKVLDETYLLANHIDKDWTTNAGVTPMNGCSGKNTRSLSIGDIVIDEAGQAWYCHMTGWLRREEHEAV